jgi:hypothetical protein
LLRETGSLCLTLCLATGCQTHRRISVRDPYWPVVGVPGVGNAAASVVCCWSDGEAGSAGEQINNTKGRSLHMLKTQSSDIRRWTPALVLQRISPTPPCRTLVRQLNRDKRKWNETRLAVSLLRADGYW